jgi:hypothetical protein
MPRAPRSLPFVVVFRSASAADDGRIVSRHVTLAAAARAAARAQRQLAARHPGGGLLCAYVATSVAAMTYDVEDGWAAYAYDRDAIADGWDAYDADVADLRSGRAGEARRAARENADA